MKLAWPLNPVAGVNSAEVPPPCRLTVPELGEPTRTLSRQNRTIEQIEPEDLLTAELPRPDVFSFHFYPGGSERCGGKMLGHSAEKALLPAWLDSIDPAIARMTALRDRAAPGAPLWDTETGEAACGGNPWASAFADSFRFVDTLGRSARQGVRVVMHNTLAASDYALLEEHGYDPRPNYWAALLWKRTMGARVLAAPSSPAPTVRLYAHCLAGSRGGVGLLALNTGDAAQPVGFGGKARAWILTGEPIDTREVKVNGVVPALAADGSLRGLDGVAVTDGITLSGKAIAFVAVPDANNPACS